MPSRAHPTSHARIHARSYSPDLATLPRGRPDRTSAGRPRSGQKRRFGFLRKLQGLLGEPRACSGNHHAPQRIEMNLPLAADPPSIVLSVVPGACAASDVARTIRLTDSLDPQIGVKQRYAGVCGWPQPQPHARRVTPGASSKSANDRGRLVGRAPRCIGQRRAAPARFGRYR
jgi:hypothetical protein